MIRGYYQKQQQYRPPRVDYSTKDYNPEVTQKSVNTIFVTIEEGNINKIRAELIANNSTLAIKTEDGESPLHILIKTSSISADNKLEIVKLMIKNSVQINSYDKYNITPLHLACKYQLSDIVTILLENGADPNAKDSQQMTPLHYLVQGEETECPKVHAENTNQVESIIKPTVGQKSNEYIENISALIIQESNQDINLKKMISNIRKTFLKTDEMFPIEYLEKESEFKNKIVEILSKNTDSEIQKNLINAQIKLFILDISNFLTNKIKGSLEKMNIRSNNNGWGPSNESFNKILDDNTPEKIINQLKINSDIRKNMNFDELKDNVSKLSDNIKLIEKTMYDVTWLVYGYNINRQSVLNIPLNLNISPLPLRSDIIQTPDFFNPLILKDFFKNPQKKINGAPDDDIIIYDLLNTSTNVNYSNIIGLIDYNIYLPPQLQYPIGTLIKQSVKSDNIKILLNNNYADIPPLLTDLYYNNGVLYLGLTDKYDKIIVKYLKYFVDIKNLYNSNINNLSIAKTELDKFNKLYQILPTIDSINKIPTLTATHSNSKNELLIIAHLLNVKYNIQTINNLSFIDLLKDKLLLEHLNYKLQYNNANNIQNTTEDIAEFTKLVGNANQNQTLIQAVQAKLLIVTNALNVIHNTLQNVTILGNVYNYSIQTIMIMIMQRLANMTQNLNNNNFIINDFNLTTRIKYYLAIIKCYMQIMEKYKIELEQKNNTFDLINFDTIMSSIKICTINICLNLIELNKEINVIYRKFSDLTLRLNTFAMKINDKHIFFIKEAIVKLKNITEQMPKQPIETFSFANNVYIKLINYVSSLSEYIDSFNKKSAIKSLEGLFSNTFNIDTLQYANNSISNFYSKPLLNSTFFPTELPRRFNEFINEYNTYEKNPLGIKQKLIEKYLPQITYDNYHTLIYSNPNYNQNLPIRFSHFLPFIDPLYIQNFNQSCLIENNFITVTPNAKLGFIYPYDSILNIFSSNNSLIPKLKNGNISKKKSINDADNNTLIGNAEYIFGSQNISFDIPIEIIGQTLNEYMMIMKYIIVRYVINKINQKINNNKVIDDYIQYIKKYNVTNDADYSILYTTVGQIVDKLLTVLIKSYIEEMAIQKTNEIAGKNNINSNLNLLDSFKYDPTKEFILNLNEINQDIDNKIDKEIQTINSIIQNTSVIESSKNNTNNIHSLYSAFGSNINNTCFKMNPEVLNTFKNFRVNVNIKDTVGRTPIFYAIEKQSIDLVKKLVTDELNATVSFPNTKDNQGRTPIEYSKSIINDLINLNINGKNPLRKLANPLYKDIKQLITTTPVFKNNTIKYTDIILPMILSLLNHSFFLHLSNYSFGWSSDDFKKLENIIKENLQNINLDKTQIPIFENIEKIPSQIVYNSSQDIYTVKTQNEIIERRLKELNDKKNILENQLLSIDQELYDDKINPERKTELNNLKIELTNEMTNNNSNITTLQNHKNNFMNENFISANKTNIMNILDSKKNNNFYTNSHRKNVIKIYDNIFVNIINENKKYLSYDTNFRIYPEIWKNYIDTSLSYNYINIELLSSKILSNIMNNSSFSLDKFNLIKKMYGNVFSYISKHYEELPQEYNNTNFVMKTVIDILTHVLKHTLITSYYNSLIKVLNKYLTTVYSTSNNTQYIQNIINNGYSNNSNSYLLDYIFNNMPILLIKVNTKVYDGDNDPVRGYDNESIFSEVTNILSRDTIIGNNNSLIKSLNDSFNPFFIEYTTLMIRHMKLFADSYFKYIIVINRNLEIYKTLYEKSNKENNNL